MGGGWRNAVYTSIKYEPPPPPLPVVKPLLPPEGKKDTPFWKNLVSAKAFSLLSAYKCEQILKDHSQFLPAIMFFVSFSKNGLSVDEAQMAKQIEDKGEEVPQIDLEDQY